jgi:hypothetical protein
MPKQQAAAAASVDLLLKPVRSKGTARRGRPPGEFKVTVSVRLPVWILEELSQRAHGQRGRSDLITSILTKALTQPDPPSIDATPGESE